MSGGHFDYKQHEIEDLASDIECQINANKGLKPPFGLTEETLAKLREAALTLRRAAKMTQRIDYLLSGDDGEETFHERWNEEIFNVRDKL